MEQDRILIVGTGAMGCFFAARLAPHIQVAMLGTWEAGLDALQKHGVRLIESDGTELNYPVKVLCDPADTSDVVSALILVKSWQTRRAAHQLQKCLAPNGIALTLQNGIGNLEILQEVLNPQRATLGVTTLGATLLEPGLVRVGGSGPTYIVPKEGLIQIKRFLSQAGLEVQEVGDLQGLIWGKLAINAGINPLTALLQVINGELLERPDAKHLMARAAKEVAAVAVAKGIKLSPQDAETQILEVAWRTAKNRSSMYQDVLRGAPTEIDVICGAVVREGRRLRIPTPVNEILWRLVRALTHRQEGSEG